VRRDDELGLPDPFSPTKKVTGEEKPIRRVSRSTGMQNGYASGSG